MALETGNGLPYLSPQFRSYFENCIDPIDPSTLRQFPLSQETTTPSARTLPLSSYLLVCTNMGSNSQVSRKTFIEYLKSFTTAKIKEKLNDEPPKPGTRLFPTKTPKNDEKSNFRAEAGPRLPDGRQEVVFRSNANAGDKNVRKHAATNGKAPVAKVTINLYDSVGEEDLEPLALKSSTRTVSCEVYNIVVAVVPLWNMTALQQCKLF
ncbi:hypothetical protein BU24DRAFT_473393 [Aaosphaeria arxii CBS 175.79]|uniref:Uncharacterized protein n=1 Tax=Aaosphaeria arxii CBS 175.79 TaxID=1450172 RepID=A0A6A5XBC6_9PLEO|nr:uncharacterized protein BU24DRAFT_473393 [Aaosphaeria arxii CBS 175.79]KAF2010203.1 hypothetical protein BU24DRAFT_473393 [Aaosphaeria arxii CBS 175.79]